MRWYVIVAVCLSCVALFGCVSTRDDLVGDLAFVKCGLNSRACN